MIGFPAKGKNILGIGYFSQNSGSEWLYQSRNYQETDVKESGIRIVSANAFSDSWAASISAEEAFSSTTKITYGPATTINGTSVEYKSSGFSDPEFGIIHRLMDISRDRYDMNISINYSPKLQNAKDASVDKKGNNARGGSTLETSLQWGRRGKDFSWAVGFSLERNGETESKDVEDGDTTKVTSHSTLSASGAFQWQLSPKVSLDLSLLLGSTGEFDVKYEDGSYLSYKSAASTTLGGSANILLKNEIYLVVGLAGSKIGDRNVSDENGDVLNNTEHSAGTFNIGVVAQF